MRTSVKITNLIAWAWGLCLVATGAFADPVHLSCKLTYGPIQRFLTIDYATGTVVTSVANSLDPMADMQGRTAQPAQVTNAQIVWQFTIGMGPGRYLTYYFTLNRVDGDLIEDQNHDPKATFPYECALGPPPAPKF